MTKNYVGWLPESMDWALVCLPGPMAEACTWAPKCMAKPSLEVSDTSSVSACHSLEDSSPRPSLYNIEVSGTGSTQ